ncbi:MAG: GNAT family N-acetyltransferase [Limnochordales bacterium]|nr:GNAT family N-acetyltransferase [Limnochordales bacterium]
MWRFLDTRAITTAIDFLKNHTYSNVDPVLWDGNLWFYGELERLLSTYGNQCGPIFAAEHDGSIGGIAFVNGATVLVDVLPEVKVASLLARLRKERTGPLSIVTCGRSAADEIMQLPGAILKRENVKLYTCSAPEGVHPEGEELVLGREYQFWRDWSSFPDLLRAGYRVFGIVADGNRVLSHAGLWPLSVRRTEVVMVGTDPDHFGKGYATSVSALALQVALQSAAIVTWSTDVSNKASLRVATKLGFRELVTLYHIMLPD